MVEETKLYMVTMTTTEVRLFSIRTKNKLQAEMSMGEIVASGQEDGYELKTSRKRKVCFRAKVV